MYVPNNWTTLVPQPKQLWYHNQQNNSGTTTNKTTPVPQPTKQLRYNNQQTTPVPQPTKQLQYHNQQNNSSTTTNQTTLVPQPTKQLQYHNQQNNSGTTTIKTTLVPQPTKQLWYHNQQNNSGTTINNLTASPSIELNSKILIGATRIVAGSQDDAAGCVPLPYKVGHSWGWQQSMVTHNNPSNLQHSKQTNYTTSTQQ
jgi:hypothetical protein